MLQGFTGLQYLRLKRLTKKKFKGNERI